MKQDRAWVGLAAGLAIMAAAAPPASAFVKQPGTFTASMVCNAYQSVMKQANPGNITVEPGKSYELLGKNRERATYYYIKIAGAEPPSRWVKTECGTISDTPLAPAPDAPGGADSGGKQQPFHVLALSWEPAFCEGKPNKTECRSMRDGQPETRQLSLHGLWPQPSRIAYCGVDKAVQELDTTFHWYDLPEVKLTPETRAALAAVMPGTQSVLERHEWIKHGTCYPGANPETYYKDAIRLTQAVNGSAVGAYLAARIGQQVTAAELRAAFDAAFGKGAGERVRLSCDRDGGRVLLSEITIGVKGDISAGTPVAALILASEPTAAGCPSGLLDPVGLQ